MTRNRYNALLKGILRCSACDAGMIHTVCTRGQRQYRYYICVQAQKRGHATCPTKTVQAASIEQEVLTKLGDLPLDRRKLKDTGLEEAIPLLSDPSTLGSAEQARLLRLIVERVTYDRATQRIGIALTEAALACVNSSDGGQAA